MKHTTVIMSLLCVIMLFFIGRYSIFLGSSFLGALSSCVLYPVLRVQQLLIEPAYGWLEAKKTITELRHSYASLYDDYEVMRAENIALKSMHYHMQEINELIDYKKRYHHQEGCIAQVLVRHISDQKQFFLINAGSRQGVKKDMIALYKNCLVGKVTDVYPWYCKICLVTDSECKVAAVCAQTGVSGILEGANTVEYMPLQYVSHLSTVQENDTVLSSGEGLIFPNGFGLGTISEICKGDLFYAIKVKPLLDFYSIRYCLLLAKEQIEKGNND